MREFSYSDNGRVEDDNDDDDSDDEVVAEFDICLAGSLRE